ncbi:uncharacterized protein LOC101846743 [Aplysia californica]|uniref:Uncharacterized protein LOC101846743 n=1 Tax=Aplysia californica TaxID=6500 RepID=A0ABM0JTB8_APLCA|nr:uncharacterized protein LOC101846743 [Aplysia californica]
MNFSHIDGTTMAPVLNPPSPTGFITNAEVKLVSGFNSIPLLLCCVFGIPANALTIRAFLRLGARDNASISFLHMAVSDMLHNCTIVIRVCTEVLGLLKRRAGVKLALPLLPFIVVNLNLREMFLTISALTTTFLAIARCMGVARPLQFKDMFTRPRTIILLVLFDVFSFASFFPVICTVGIVYIWNPKTNTSKAATWFAEGREEAGRYVHSLDFVLPLITEVIIIMCFVVMVIKLKEASRFRKASQSAGEKESENAKGSGLSSKEVAVLQQVSLVCFIYISLNSAKVITAIVTFVVPGFSLGQRYTNLYSTFHEIRMLFETLCASVNFIIYYKYNARFREACGIGSSNSVHGELSNKETSVVTKSK